MMTKNPDMQEDFEMAMDTLWDAEEESMSLKMIVKVWDENRQLRCKLALDPADVEEALARCGFMILNDAENVTPEHRAEIVRCERFGASMTTGSQEAALAWWNARKVS